MKKQQYLTGLSTKSSESNYDTKRESLLDQFILWFRRFLDNQ
jgi:hypothetical protein